MSTRTAPPLLALLVCSLAACGGGNKTAEKPSESPSPMTPASTSADQAGSPSPAAATVPSAFPTPAPQSPAPTSPGPGILTPSPPNAGVPAEWTLTTAGWGPVRPGQPIPASLRDSFKPAWECQGQRHPRTGEELVEVYTAGAAPSGPVTVISLMSPRVRTASGVRVGDSLTKLRTTYPKLADYQAPRGSGWMMRVWYLQDDHYHLFFEVDDRQTVRHISVQTYEQFHPMSKVGPCGAP